MKPSALLRILAFLLPVPATAPARAAGVGNNPANIYLAHIKVRHAAP